MNVCPIFSLFSSLFQFQPTPEGKYVSLAAKCSTMFTSLSLNLSVCSLVVHSDFIRVFSLPAMAVNNTEPE